MKANLLRLSLSGAKGRSWLGEVVRLRKAPF